MECPSLNLGPFNLTPVFYFSGDRVCPINPGCNGPNTVCGNRRWIPLVSQVRQNIITVVLIFQW